MSVSSSSINADASSSGTVPVRLSCGTASIPVISSTGTPASRASNASSWNDFITPRIWWVFQGGQSWSTSSSAFCWSQASFRKRATSRVSCWSSGRASLPTSWTISWSSASSSSTSIAHWRCSGQFSATFSTNHGSSWSRYSEYDSFQFIAGKCRRSARSESSAQKVFTMRSVFWVTGSEKSPPGGDTAPITETDPSVPFMFSKYPARS